MGAQHVSGALRQHCRGRETGTQPSLQQQLSRRVDCQGQASPKGGLAVWVLRPRWDTCRCGVGTSFKQGLPGTLVVRGQHTALCEEAWGPEEVGSDEGPSEGWVLTIVAALGMAASSGAPRKPKSGVLPGRPAQAEGTWTPGSGRGRQSGESWPSRSGDHKPSGLLGKPTQPAISVSLQREGPGPPASSPLGPVSLPSQGQGSPPKPPNLSCESCCGEKYTSFQLKGPSEPGHLPLRVGRGEARGSPGPAPKPQQECGADEGPGRGLPHCRPLLPSPPSGLSAPHPHPAPLSAEGSPPPKHLN